jgi:hypothetical protein
VTDAAKRALALVVLIAGAATITALLTDGHSSSAQAAVRRAAGRTLDAGSSRFTIKRSFTGVVSPSMPEWEERGIMDYRRHLGSIRDSLFGWEEIYDGDTVYERLASVISWVPKDKPWLRSTESDDPFDPEAKALRDPTRLLHFLRLTSTDVRKVGTEEIGGVQTTHYEGTLDLQKVVDQAPAAERSVLQDDLDFMKGDTGTTISYGLWVDASDIARRLRIDDAGGNGSETIDFFDYGVTVDVQPPPESAVLRDDEFTALVEQHTNVSGCNGQKSEPKAESVEGKTVLCLGSASVSLTRSK